jgi:hypothetical protein
MQAFRFNVGDTVISTGRGRYIPGYILVITERYMQEGEEFIGMSDAVEAAIRIAEQWEKDDGEQVFIASGCTHGMFTELEGEPYSPELATKLREAAKEFDATLPCCHYCGDLIQEKYQLTDYDDCEFCSENCASNYAEQEYRERLKEEQDEEDRREEEDNDCE